MASVARPPPLRQPPCHERNILAARPFGRSRKIPSWRPMSVHLEP